MTWEQLPIPSTFGRARRREIYRRFGRLVRGEESHSLLPLEEVQERLRLFEQIYVGIRPIPVGKIVGSAGRSRDFDSSFLPRRPEMRARWRAVEQAFPDVSFPPIVVYEVGEAYFVVDGHHRVAIAKQRRLEFVDAEITRLRSRYEFPADADIGRIIYLEQQRIFYEDSGLARARPEAQIEFSNPLGFAELLELVKLHGYHLMMARAEIIPPAAIASDWFDAVYGPAVATIHDQGLTDAFPRATEADLFLWVYQRRRALFPERGGMTLEEAARLLAEEQQRRFRMKARLTSKKLARRDAEQSRGAE